MMYCEICGRKTYDGVCVECLGKSDAEVSQRRLGSDVYDFDGYVSEYGSARKASQKQLDYIINMMEELLIEDSIVKMKTNNLTRDKASHLINKLKELTQVGLATEKQKDYIRELLKKTGCKESDYKWDMELMGKKQAANIIEELQSLINATPAQINYANNLVKELGYSLEQIEEMGYEFQEDNGKIANMNFYKVKELITALKQELG